MDPVVIQPQYAPIGSEGSVRSDHRASAAMQKKCARSKNNLDHDRAEKASAPTKSKAS